MTTVNEAGILRMLQPMSVDDLEAVKASFGGEQALVEQLRGTIGTAGSAQAAEAEILLLLEGLSTTDLQSLSVGLGKVYKEKYSADAGKSGVPEGVQPPQGGSIRELYTHCRSYAAEVAAHEANHDVPLSGLRPGYDQANGSAAEGWGSVNAYWDGKRMHRGDNAKSAMERGSSIDGVDGKLSASPSDEALRNLEIVAHEMSHANSNLNLAAAKLKLAWAADNVPGFLGMYGGHVLVDARINDGAAGDVEYDGDKLSIAPIDVERVRSLRQKEMAISNATWGAKRIRGELLKVGIRVSKRTIQKHMRQVRPPGKRSQSWRTSIRNHTNDIWACDFLQLYDAWFMPIFVFFVVKHGSREAAHFSVTRSPSDEWTAQQLREATPWGQGPRFLIRDNDGKYGPRFAAVAKGTGIEVVSIPPKSPNLNPICERFLGSVRRECLDHVVILGEEHLDKILHEYVGAFFNIARPHHGIEQQIPGAVGTPAAHPAATGKIVGRPILGELHHDYRRAA